MAFLTYAALPYDGGGSLIIFLHLGHMNAGIPPDCSRMTLSDVERGGDVHINFSLIYAMICGEPSFCSRRMYTDGAQCPTQIEEFRAVQMQCLYCRTTRCGTPTDDHEVLIPCKMPCPVLAARGEERDKSSGLRVKCMSFSVCMAVTRWTCPG